MIFCPSLLVTSRKYIPSRRDDKLTVLVCFPTLPFSKTFKPETSNISVDFIPVSV